MPTVGEILRTEREHKGLTIKDIEKTTSIRALYLNAIEEGNYSILPGEVYLKGFIRNYAIALGLDGQEMVKLYRESKAENDVIEQQPDKMISDQKKQVTNRSESNVISGLFNRSTKYIAAAAVTIIIMGSSYWFYSTGNNTPPAEMTKPAPQIEQNTAAMPPPVPQKAVLTAKYSANCWTLVLADGKQIYEGTPSTGQSLTWEGKKSITIKLGNASAAEITFNNQPIGKLGGQGEVVVKSFNVQ